MHRIPQRSTPSRTDRSPARRRKRRSTLAILAATAGVFAFASSAQAVVVQNEPVGMIGDPQEMLRDSWLALDFTGGRVIPRLTGTLEVNNAEGSCFALRITEYDGATFLHSRRGAKHCVTDGDDHAFPIALNGVGDALTDTVDVDILQETAASGWSKQDGREVTLETSTDSVTFDANGLDLTGPTNTTAGGTPTSAATVSWPIDNGLVTPTFDGYVIFEDFLPCARVRLLLRDETGALVEEVRGPKHCAPDAGYHRFHDVLAGTPSDVVTEMEVVLERKAGGDWIEVESDTVSIAP
jgi:hypothetical protein